MLLVSMPWQRADAPSLQLGILKAWLVRTGVKVKTLHAAPLLSRKLGSSLYWRVANNLHPLLSEACFVFVRRNVRQEALREALIATEELTEAESARVMDAVRDFCATLRERAPWRGFDVAGFSCTFNQLQASLWAAQEAKRHGCRTLFGGSLPWFRYGKGPLCATHFSGSGALVTDGRFARLRQYHLPRAAARVLLACRTPQPRARLLAVGKERTGELLRELTQRNLLLEEDGCYAALPVLVPEKRELLSLSRRDSIDSWFSPPIATAREEATYAH